jgi:hypothetical protein
VFRRDTPSIAIPRIIHRKKARFDSLIHALITRKPDAISNILANGMPGVILDGTTR